LRIGGEAVSLPEGGKGRGRKVPRIIDRRLLEASQARLVSNVVHGNKARHLLRAPTRSGGDGREHKHAGGP